MKIPTDLTPREDAYLDRLVDLLDRAIATELPRLELVHVALELEVRPGLQLAGAATTESLQ